MADGLVSYNRAYEPQLFFPELKQLPPSISSLLASYSNIPVEKQKQHITTVRDQAYKSHPYPCLGRWRFLDLDLASHPLYQSHILPMLAKNNKNNNVVNSAEQKGTFLDLGCCLGQDVRKLIFDGGDPARIYGADLRPEFIDMGYELFQDENKFPRSEHFAAPADVFDFSTETELSKKCDGKVGILHSTAVFHLFSWEEQTKMALRCLQLLDPKVGKALICGGQVGNINAGEVSRRNGGGSRYRHNEESWKRFWQEVVQTDPWRERVKGVEVHSVLEERNMDGSNEQGQPQNVSNTDQRRIGLTEDGFRWQKWWVWVEFT